MNLPELYELLPPERHQDIVVSADRVFFDEDEYVIDASGQLILIRSSKALEQRLAQIEAKLGITQ